MRAKYKHHGLSCLHGEEGKKPYGNEAGVLAKPFLSGRISSSTGGLDRTILKGNKLIR